MRISLWVAGLATASALLLVGCATPPAYRAAAAPGQQGFSETRIETNRYRITFQGQSGATAAEVVQLALRRAAELTTGAGAEWFVVDRQDVDALEPSNKPGRFTLGLGGGGGSFGGGVGAGVGVDLSPRRGARVDLLIRTGSGAKPEAAYDARAILVQSAN